MGILLRWILLIAIFFIFLIFPDQINFTPLLLKRLFFVSFIYLFIISILPKNKTKANIYQLGIYACDIILGGILISATGGIKSFFFPVVYFLMFLNSFALKNLQICIGGIFYTLTITLIFSILGIGFNKLLNSENLMHCLKETLMIILMGVFPVSILLKETKAPKINFELEKAYETSRKLAESSQEKDVALAEKSRKLIGLIQIARLMGVASRLSDLLEVIVSKSLDMLNTRIGFLMLVKGNELKIIFSHGISDITKKVFECKIGEGFLGKVASFGKPIRLSLKDAQLQNLTGTLEKIKNVLAVPMISPHDNKLIGILGVANLLTEEEFTEVHEEYLKILAVDAAISIKNRVLYEDLERSYLEMIQGLAQAVEARDPYTYGHIDRVSSYSVGIARNLKLPQLEIEIIKRAAVLHDIGKIGTPDNVLLKPGPLDKEEREIMNKHVIKAVDILRDISAVNKEILDIIKHHHEKYDGGGYPDRLKGEQIPLGAQIIAIADTFDAIVTDRPYRNGMPPEEALKIIQKEAGTQFNPEVVSAFLTFMMGKGGI